MKLFRFYTTLSPSCKEQAELLKNFGMDNLKIVNIDCMKKGSVDIILDFNVQSVPQLILTDDDENFVRRFKGIMQPDSLRAIIENDMRQLKEE